jgi:hypothetical protein
MTEHAIVATTNENHNVGYVANLLSMMNLGQYQGQSAQPGLSVATLSKVEMRLPKKEVQDKIFQLLSTLDEKIALNNQINATLEQMAKTLYDYWFVQFDFPDDNGKPYKSSGGEMVYNETLKRDIPKGWGVKQLNQLITVKDGTHNSPRYVENGYPLKVPREPRPRDGRDPRVERAARAREHRRTPPPHLHRHHGRRGPRGGPLADCIRQPDPRLPLHARALRPGARRAQPRAAGPRGPPGARAPAFRPPAPCPRRG